MTNPSLRELSMEWFLSLDADARINMKNKHFASTPISYDSHWGFHFTFGQIQSMYYVEHRHNNQETKLII